MPPPAEPGGNGQNQAANPFLNGGCARFGTYNPFVCPAVLGQHEYDSHGVSSAVQQIGVNPFVNRAHFGWGPTCGWHAAWPLTQLATAYQMQACLTPEQQPPAYVAMTSAVSTSPGSMAADPADMSGGETEGDAFDMKEVSHETEAETSQTMSKGQEKLKCRQLAKHRARAGVAAEKRAAGRSRAKKLAAELKATDQPASLPNIAGGRQAGAAEEVSCCGSPGNVSPARALGRQELRVAWGSAGSSRHAVAFQPVQLDCAPNDSAPNGFQRRRTPTHRMRLAHTGRHRMCSCGPRGGARGWCSPVRHLGGKFRPHMAMRGPTASLSGPFS